MLHRALSSSPQVPGLDKGMRLLETHPNCRMRHGNQNLVTPYNLYTVQADCSRKALLIQMTDKRLVTS